MARIEERNGSYRITVSCGYVNGKQKRETTTFTPDPTMTRTQQKVALQSFVAEFEMRARSGKITNEKMKLSSLYEMWFKNYVQKELEPSSHWENQYRMEKIILPALGDYKLIDLTPLVVDRFLRDLEKGGRVDGKEGGYADATIRKIRSILSSCLQYGVSYGLLPQNPCSMIRRNHHKVSQERLKYWTPEQAQRFLQVIERPIPIFSKPSQQVRKGKIVNIKPYDTKTFLTVRLKYRVLYGIALFSGLRRGEILALTWESIDFNNCALKVSQATGRIIEDGHATQYVKAPKTQAGFRTVTVPASLISLIKQLRKEQRKEILQKGSAWVGEHKHLDKNFLFTQEDGTQMAIDTPNLELHRIIDCYNRQASEDEQLPVITLHGLRHTNCTLMISKDVDTKTVMSRMGHSDISVTMNIYSHELREREQKAADILEDVLRYG